MAWLPEEWHDFEADMPLVSDLIRETLGPDVQTDVWQGTIMPVDAVYERRISYANMRDWWAKAHRQARKAVRDYRTFGREIDYHTRFVGYCPFCSPEDEVF